MMGLSYIRQVSETVSGVLSLVISSFQLPGVSKQAPRSCHGNHSKAHVQNTTQLSGAFGLPLGNILEKAQKMGPCPDGL